MRSIWSSSIYWRLAWRNLKSQRGQTVLTIVGGCIGAALIIASTIFFQSFDESGNRWFEKHYGPIEWELRPPDNQSYFSAEQLPSIEQSLQIQNLKHLSAVTFETRVSKVDGELQAVRTGMRYLGIGVDFTQASLFDPDNQLWDQSLSPDQIILSEAIAKPLDINEGDTVALTGTQGEERLFQVKQIVEEEGISGYRGSTSLEGTLIMGIDNARLVAGLPEHLFTSIFTGMSDHSYRGTKPPHFPSPSPLFEVRELKQSDYNQVQQMKKRHGFTFVLCSVTAIMAGLLLLAQILFMLADSRRETMGILRALGYRRRQTQAIFFIEALLINLLSTGVGIGLGIPLGYGIIKLFGLLNRDLIFAYSANTVPIVPYISLGGILFTGIIIICLLMFTSFISCYKLGNMHIVSALRGDSNPIEPRSAIRSKVIRICLIICSVVILAIHFIQLVTGQGIEILIDEGNSSWISSTAVLALWFMSSIASLYLVVQMLPFLQKLLKPLLNQLGIGEAAQMVAFRYPAGNYRRTFVVTLLFSCCFMLLTFVIIITQHYYRNIEQKPYSVLGYPAYIKYESESEKQQILPILNQNSELGEIVRNSTIMEPYMIRTASDGALAPMNQLNVTIPGDEQMSSDMIKLSERHDDYASDLEAWKAVKSNPQYVILDKKFSYAPEEWPSTYRMDKMLLRPLKVGDQLKLDIYEKPAEPNTPAFGKEPQVVSTIDIQIIGFADTTTGLEFYNVMFVNPHLYNELREQGYRWESTPEKGYLMLPLMSNDTSYLRSVEEHVVSLGINGFSAPGISEASEDISLIQMLWVFNGFMIVAMGIGLAGLAILQLRALQERLKTIAMMRCIGLSRRIVRQMLLLEGTMIGWIGLLNGCLFGTIGGYAIVELLESTKKPTEPALSFVYPWEYIIPIVCILMLLTLLLHIGPSRRILRLSPSDAIRLSDE